MSDKMIFDLIHSATSHLNFEDKNSDKEVALIVANVLSEIGLNEIVIMEGLIEFTNKKNPQSYEHTWILINRQIYDPTLIQYKNEKLHYVIYKEIINQYSPTEYYQKYNISK